MKKPAFTLVFGCDWILLDVDMVEAAGVEPASEIVGNKERLHAQSCSAGFALRTQNRQDARIASP